MEKFPEDGFRGDFLYSLGMLLITVVLASGCISEQGADPDVDFEGVKTVEVRQQIVSSPSGADGSRHMIKDMESGELVLDENYSGRFFSPESAPDRFSVYLKEGHAEGESNRNVGWARARSGGLDYDPVRKVSNVEKTRDEIRRMNNFWTDIPDDVTRENVMGAYDVVNGYRFSEYGTQGGELYVANTSDQLSSVSPAFSRYLKIPEDTANLVGTDFRFNAQNLENYRVEVRMENDRIRSINETYNWTGFRPYRLYTAYDYSDEQVEMPSWAERAERLHDGDEDETVEYDYELDENASITVRMPRKELTQREKQEKLYLEYVQRRREEAARGVLSPTIRVYKPETSAVIGLKLFDTVELDSNTRLAVASTNYFRPGSGRRPEKLRYSETERKVYANITAGTAFYVRNQSIFN